MNILCYYVQYDSKQYEYKPCYLTPSRTVISILQPALFYRTFNFMRGWTTIL